MREKISETSLSRRSMLKGAMATAAGSLSLSSVTAQATIQSWDETYEMVVIGSGFAGLSAAYEALKNGIKHILILEKMDVFGGNSAINGGQVSLPLSALQKEKGVEDSVDMMVADMLKAGRGFNHVALSTVVAQEAAGCYDMMVDCGVRFQNKLIRLGGHSAARTIITENGSGGGIVVPMHKYLKEKGVVFRNKTLVNKIIFDGNNAVHGVSTVPNYDFNRKAGAAEKQIKATKGVIVASGGWGSDHRFISTTMPGYSTLECTSQKGATAETIQMLLASGALPIMVDMYQLGPWACPDEFGAGAASLFADYIFAEGIMVDRRNGKRFVNELASRRDRAEAQLKLIGPDGKPNYPFGFCSEQTTKTAEGFKASWREGTTKKTNSIEELAALYDAPVEPLRQQINEWNNMVENSIDTEFGKPIDKKIKLEAPFYSVRFWPKLHYCIGGVGITPKAEVIHVQTCEPIPGLYAAGEITGGVHGMDRLGSSSSTDGLSMGRVAGRSLAMNTR